MTEAEPPPLSVGRVGRPHGLDGSFIVHLPHPALGVGSTVGVGDRETTVDRLAGTRERTIVHLAGLDSREAAVAIGGEVLYALGIRLGPGEYLVEDLLRCVVPGLGAVNRVLAAPSCDLLDVGDDAVLIPLVRDAIERVDTETGVIEVDRSFLGL